MRGLQAPLPSIGGIRYRARRKYPVNVRRMRSLRCIVSKLPQVIGGCGCYPKWNECSFLLEYGSGRPFLICREIIGLKVVLLFSFLFTFLPKLQSLITHIHSVSLFEGWCHHLCFISARSEPRTTQPVRFDHHAGSLQCDVAAPIKSMPHLKRSLATNHLSFALKARAFSANQIGRACAMFWTPCASHGKSRVEPGLNSSSSQPRTALPSA